MNTQMTTTTRHIFLIFFLVFLITSCSTTQQGSAGSGDSQVRKFDYSRPATFRDRY